MTPRWRWLLVAIIAVTVGCLAPGSELSGTVPSVGRTASLEPAAPTPAPSGSECAAVACNRGSASSPGMAPALAVAGILAVLAAVVPIALAVRRRRPTRAVLPAGTPLLLFRPPQLSPLHR